MPMSPDVDPAPGSPNGLQQLATITAPLPYKDRQISFLDLTTLSPTGTFKDWVASVTIAFCIEHGITEFVTQTSGNTGNAIAAYAAANGIRVTILYPAVSRYKIDASLASAGGITFVELDKSEEIIKEYTALFSKRFGVPWLPTTEHQMDANAIRANVVANYMVLSNARFDWHVQALSSGYGVFGFYRGMDRLRQAPQYQGLVLPRFLGVQQEAVAPYYASLYHAPPCHNSRLIEPTLFRSKPPQWMIDEMKMICERTGGRVIKLTNRAYETYEQSAITMMAERGINLTVLETARGPQLLEKSGVIATAGVLREIEDGRIDSESRILVAITGGTSRGTRGIFKPQWRLDASATIEQLYDCRRT